MASLGPIGCIPFQLTFRLSRAGQCSAKVNAQALEFNSALLGLVNELNANLPGAKFVYADAYKSVSEMIANPSAFGEFAKVQRISYQMIFKTLFLVHRWY